MTKRLWLGLHLGQVVSKLEFPALLTTALVGSRFRRPLRMKRYSANSYMHCCTNVDPVATAGMLRG